MLYIVGGITIGVFITVLLSSAFSRGVGYGGMMSWRSNRGEDNQFTSKTTNSVNQIDKHFIEQMIPHHEGAIDMSKLALQKAKHAEVKILAEAIIGAQTKEIGDMKDWYKSWFNKDVENQDIYAYGMVSGGMMSRGGMHMGGKEDMTALENATDFDKAFIEKMIPHHQLAIMMAQMLKSGTNRPEMLTLANNIIESQSKEIEQMREWYKEWGY